MTLFGDVSTDTVFRNRDVLKDRYQPDEIVGRSEEKNRLKSALRPVIAGTGSPDNVFISGPSGTGKTALTRAATSELEGMDEVDVGIQWLNCKPVNGETPLMLSIANLFRESGNKLKTTGYSESQARDLLFSEIEESEDEQILVVLDELDTVGGLDNFLYHLPRAHEFGLETEVGVIAISNNPDFLTNLPNEVSSTLTDVHIQFSEYDATQLGEVLKQRSTLAFRDTEIDEDGEIDSPVIDNAAVTLAAARGAKNSGDARMARDVLRNAADLAVERGDEKVGVDHVEDAFAEYHRSRMVETVANLSPSAKKVLYALVTLHEGGAEEPRTSEVNRRYRKLVLDESTAVSKRQVSNHLKKFSRLGLTSRKRHTGGGGNYATHTLQYEPSTILEPLETVVGRDETEGEMGVHKSVREHFSD